MISLDINYHSSSSKLCEIGAKYDTDKSSQRKNVTNTRHCHPYTLFYDSLFCEYVNEQLNIAEIGILHGASLLMWREYFPNANIYGFDNNPEYIEQFKASHGTNNVFLNHMDVSDKKNISDVFQNTGIQYDIIIEDSTHLMDHQVNVIESCVNHLKPGGILIIEDVFKKYNEMAYIKKIENVLDNFQEYYFVSLDHERRNSTGWDNDKLFILIKEGERIFKNKNKITIITPSCRPSNLIKLNESIDFDYVTNWIIVYDGSKVNENPHLFSDNDKIKEYVCNDEGNFGNAQRNYALNMIKNINNEPSTYLYFLDDDNIIHPQLYFLLDVINKNQFYTFNQVRGPPEQEETSYILKGNNVEIGSIDTAMILIDYNLCKEIRWHPEYYQSDGMYIGDCYNVNKDKWIFVDNNLSYYNAIQ
jgi:predicted O-methyltransferase YrrM